MIVVNELKYCWSLAFQHRSRKNESVICLVGCEGDRKIGRAVSENETHNELCPPSENGSIQTFVVWSKSILKYRPRIFHKRSVSRDFHRRIMHSNRIFRMLTFGRPCIPMWEKKVWHYTNNNFSFLKNATLRCTFSTRCKKWLIQ